MAKKDDVHGSYLKELRGTYGDRVMRDAEEMSVIIVGSDREDNIGAGIAGALDMVVGSVHEPRLEEVDVKHPGDLAMYIGDHDLDPDVLVLSHGYAKLDWIEDMEYEEVAELIDTNLTGTILAIQSFVRMTKRLLHRKRIVVIGSMAHRNVLNGSAVYCASKAGVAHLVRCLGWELTPKGFDTFAVHPSNTLGTPMSRRTIEEVARYRGLTLEEAEGYWASVNLMPRWLETSDIGEVVRFLITEEAAGFLSGTQIDLAGGQR
jgi:NAD(P)-dependent dehydrogenase (short-subunit alcohol dehydrogenase family)